jgi:protein-disulfide isomerase
MKTVNRKTARLLPGLAALALAAGLLSAAAAQADSVIAKIDGKPVTETEVKTKAAQPFSQLDREFEQKRHDLLDDQLRQMVRDRLVETEAAAKHVSKDQLLQDALKSAEVSDADADKFYEENKARIPQGTTKEQIMPQIKNYLAQQKQTDLREKFYADLENRYKVEYLLEPIRVSVDTEGFPAKGPKDAPVTIVEFSDFQCPFCSRVVPTISEIEKKYAGKVRLVFRQYPLPFHPNAPKAAEAALCANEQGKFWEMHDAMFSDQNQLAVDNLKATAAKLGLKADDFNKCLDSGKQAATVQADISAGSAAGVSGTPTLFINGVALSGAQPLEQFTKIIDQELKRKGVATAASK